MGLIFRKAIQPRAFCLGFQEPRRDVANGSAEANGERMCGTDAGDSKVDCRLGHRRPFLFADDMLDENSGAWASQSRIAEQVAIAGALRKQGSDLGPQLLNLQQLLARLPCGTDEAFNLADQVRWERGPHAEGSRDFVEGVTLKASSQIFAHAAHSTLSCVQGQGAVALSVKGGHS